MSACALMMAILLAAQPVAAQASSIEAPDGADPPAAALAPVDIPANLQLAFELMKQPGPHPELLELLGIEVAPVRAPMSPPAPAMETWHWIWIGVAIGIAVLFLGLYLGMRNA